MDDININIYTNLIQRRNHDHYLKKASNLEVRYLAGEDAGEILKVRKNASDKEFENWMYKPILRERQGQQQGLYVFAQESE